MGNFLKLTEKAWVNYKDVFFFFFFFFFLDGTEQRIRVFRILLLPEIKWQPTQNSSLTEIENDCMMPTSRSTETKPNYYGA